MRSDFGTIVSSVLNYPRKTKKSTEMYFLEKILEPDCTKKVALLYGYFSQYLVNEFVFFFGAYRMKPGDVVCKNFWENFWENSK